MSYPFNEGPPCACKTYQVHKHLGGAGFYDYMRSHLTALESIKTH